MDCNFISSVESNNRFPIFKLEFRRYYKLQLLRFMTFMSNDQSRDAVLSLSEINLVKYSIFLTNLRIFGTKERRYNFLFEILNYNFWEKMSEINNSDWSYDHLNITGTYSGGNVPSSGFWASIVYIFTYFPMISNGARKSLSRDRICLI